MIEYLREWDKCAHSRLRMKSTQEVEVNHGYKFSDKLNAEFLQESYGNNLEFGKKMFSIFLESIDGDLEDLQLAIHAKDYVHVKGVAHKIKNNFTWVGLPQLSSVMYKLEMAAGNKSQTLKDDFNEFLSLFKQERVTVDTEYTRLSDHLSCNQ